LIPNIFLIHEFRDKKAKHYTSNYIGNNKIQP
jgi:hypothetical protein